jgi:hypothetical protein
VAILYRVTVSKGARSQAQVAQREAAADAEGRREMEASGFSELSDDAPSQLQLETRRRADRAATTTGTPYRLDESGPSGVRPVSPVALPVRKKVGED